MNAQFQSHIVVVRKRKERERDKYVCDVMLWREMSAHGRLVWQKRNKTEGIVRGEVGVGRIQ